MAFNQRKGHRMDKHSAKRYLKVCTMLVSVAALDILAALPPKYLAIKDFDRCLTEQDMGSYRAWCLPAKKPAACPQASWQQLNQLTGPDKVPDC
jgi:hypothetical protein